MMKNKLIIAVILAFIMFFALTGCQLALENGVAEITKDRLIGVYVSYEYIDLFNIEGFLNDNGNFSGGEIELNGDTKKHERRMYAVKKDVVKTASQGEKFTETNFVFEEVDGIGMFSPTISDPLMDNRTYIASCGDEGFTDVKMHIKASDNEEGLELEGTVYITPDGMVDTVYINPVYQASDDRVYLVSGQGFSVEGDSGEGGVYTQTFTESINAIENGKNNGYNASVKVFIETKNPTEVATIIQMDKDNKIIKAESYKAEEMPPELALEPATEYIIVEATKLSFDKKIETERTLYSKNDDTLWVLRRSDNRILVKVYSTILWEPTSQVEQVV